MLKYNKGNANMSVHINSFIAKKLFFLSFIIFLFFINQYGATIRKTSKNGIKNPNLVLCSIQPVKYSLSFPNMPKPLPMPNMLLNPFPKDNIAMIIAISNKYT